MRIEGIASTLVHQVQAVLGAARIDSLTQVSVEDIDQGIVIVRTPDAELKMKTSENANLLVRLISTSQLEKCDGKHARIVMPANNTSVINKSLHLEMDGVLMRHRRQSCLLISYVISGESFTNILNPCDLYDAVEIDIDWDG